MTRCRFECRARNHLGCSRRGFAEQSEEAHRKERVKSALKPATVMREIYAQLSITRALSYGAFLKIHCAIAAKNRAFHATRNPSLASRC